MAAIEQDWVDLYDEHGRIIREYGRAQQRTSDTIGAQARAIAALRAQVMQLRAAAVVQKTTLIWMQEELAAMKAASKPAKRLQGQVHAALSACRGRFVVWISPEHPQADGADVQQFDAGLAEADLVICQAGCVSCGDWWRVKDYCSRTGKQCVLVEQPDALDRVSAERV